MAAVWEHVEGTPDARVIISLPPGHGKSEVEISAVAWALARGHGWDHGVKRVAFACYGESLAAGFSGAVRDRLQRGSILSSIFGLPTLATQGETAWRFAGEPPNRPTCVAVGVLGPLTGKHADLILIDDPIKTPEDARSDLYKQRLFRWWNGVIRGRLKPGGRVVIVATRWCEDDLSGHLLANEPGTWHIVNMPALTDGEALWPEWKSSAELRAIQAVDPRTFEAMYQGNPTPDKGTVWDRAWFEPAMYRGTAPWCPIVATAWDTASKVGAGHSLSAWCRGGLDERGDIWIYVCDGRRMEFPKLKEAVTLGAGGAADEVAIIEDASSGIALLQSRADLGRPSIAVQPIDGKAERAEAVTPYCEAGRVHLAADQVWTESLLAQLAAFPNRPNDKHDAFVHLVAYLKSKVPELRPTRIGGFA